MMKTALMILEELIAIKALGEEIGRRKQRRIHAIKRDPAEVAAVRKLKAEHEERRRTAWGWAHALVGLAAPEQAEAPKELCNCPCCRAGISAPHEFHLEQRTPQPTASKPDYRELLRKYIQHVEACESVNFLNHHHGDLTDDERTQLQAIADGKA